MKKRVMTAALIFSVLFELLAIRILWLSAAQQQVLQTVEEQSSYSVIAASLRPGFCDRNGVPLTGTDAALYAVVVPRTDAAYDLLAYIDESDLERYEDARLSGSGLPGIYLLCEPLPGNIPIKTVEIPLRVSSDTQAVHLIGTRNYEGAGESGLELELEGYLGAHTAQVKVTVFLDAAGRAVKAAELHYPDLPDDVVLSIDAEIQAIAEAAADVGFSRGAIVVLDVETGELLAMVSRPDFDLSNLEPSLTTEHSPFLNRAISAYNVGSVFKPVVAAAALEAGIYDFETVCTGTVEIGGVSYSCDNGTAHGAMNLAHALKVSCNTYFIELGSRVGADAILNMAKALGFGREIPLYGMLKSSAGNLPTRRELNRSWELCNLCFGQGRLLASPLQLACCMQAIANGGVFVPPSVVLMIGGERMPQGERRRVMSEQTAATLQAYLTSAAKDGTGRYAQPDGVSAAGKTGTAETAGEDSIGWFAGFFPAEDPKYVIVVMTEGEGYGYLSAAPVFKAVADGILAIR